MMERESRYSENIIQINVQSAVVVISSKSDLIKC